MPGLCSAQSTSNRQAPDGLKIVGARWRYRVSSHRANSQDTSTGANGALMLPDHSRVTQTDGSEAVVTLKNDGPKIIRRVSYLFLFVDPEKGQGVAAVSVSPSRGDQAGRNGNLDRPDRRSNG